MNNPKRLYETERKRQQRARAAAGQVHRVAVYLTPDEVQILLDRSRTNEELASVIVRLVRDADIRGVVAHKGYTPSTNPAL